MGNDGSGGVNVHRPAEADAEADPSPIRRFTMKSSPPPITFSNPSPFSTM
jgi:hypothetical protein